MLTSESLLRHKTYLLWGVIFAFVIGLGITIAKPALLAQSLAADEQIICLGKGGMKVVKFLPDGSVQERQAAQSMDCPLCNGFATPLLPASQSKQGLQANTSLQSAWGLVRTYFSFSRSTPPSHAPPAVF